MMTSFKPGRVTTDPNRCAHDLLACRRCGTAEPGANRFYPPPRRHARDAAGRLVRREGRGAREGGAVPVSARVFEVDGRVAIRDRIDEPWQLGTIAGFTPGGYLLVRGDGGDLIAIRRPDDPRVQPVEAVPIDERHWLPQLVRDQLARQQAARQLYALVAALPPCAEAEHLRAVAYDLDDVLDGDPGTWRAHAARELLATTDEPALTP